MKISILTGFPLEHPEVDIRCNEKNEEHIIISRRYAREFYKFISEGGN